MPDRCTGRSSHDGLGPVADRQLVERTNRVPMSRTYAASSAGSRTVKSHPSAPRTIAGQSSEPTLIRSVDESAPGRLHLTPAADHALDVGRGGGDVDDDVPGLGHRSQRPLHVRERVGCRQLARPEPRAGRRSGPASRSTRKVRQSSRSTSQATRYQRRPSDTSRCGSTSGAGSRRRGRRSRSAAARRRGRPGRSPSARRVDRRAAADRSRHGVRAAARRPGGAAAAASPARPWPAPAPTSPRCRRPRRPPPSRRPTAMATASSSSSSSGGSARRPELVPAGDAAAGVDRVAQLAQPVDVAAQGALADLEPVGQLGARPVAVGLQQRQQPQHPRARVGHGSRIVTLRTGSGRKCS